MPKPGEGAGVVERPEVNEKEREKIQEPPMYRVFLENDDRTPFEFVLQVLVEIFQKTHHEAVRIMMEAHTTGASLAGIYPRDLAETRVEQVRAAASAYGYPLSCCLEPDK